MIITNRPAKIHEMLEPWIRPDLLFMWVADGVGPASKPRVGNTLIRADNGALFAAGGLINSADGGAYLTGTLPFSIPSNSPFYVGMIVTPTKTSQRGAFLKIGDSSSGLGFGCGSKTFDSAGSRLVGVREALAWVEAGNSDDSFTSGANIVFAGTFSDLSFEWQLKNLATGKNSSTGTGGGTWVAPANTIHINGYGTRGSSAVVHAVAVWSTSTSLTTWDRYAEFLRAPVRSLEGMPLESMRRLFVPPARKLWLSGAAGGSASTGTGSTTLDNLTLSATASITAQGQASIALAGVTLSATGSITNRGAATPTLADVTLSATGASVNQGEASITLADATLSATGSIANRGAATPTLADVTLSAAGSITAQGAANITLADLSLAATGESTPVGSGTASITLDDVSVAATGSLVSRGQATVTLEDLSLLASGSVTNRGEASITLADLSLSATGGEAVSTLDLILKILSNRQELDPTSGLFTIYDDDGSTVLYTAAAWEDAAGTIPYRGQALRRIDRLSI